VRWRVSLELVAQRLTSGRIVGIDISEEMAIGAARRFAEPAAVARVRVLRADVSAVPLVAYSFDRAYSVNGVFFRPDPDAALAEIYRMIAERAGFVHVRIRRTFGAAQVSGRR
jgi:arsenite methyltransferase